MSTTSRFVCTPVLIVIFAAPVAAQTSSCERIRDAIKAQTGLLVKPNADLLQTLSLRQECRFTADEVYRAAYGDKPLPKPETRGRNKHHDDDD